MNSLGAIYISFLIAIIICCPHYLISHYNGHVFSLLEICHPFFKSAEQQLPAYTFTQTLEDITVQFTIPENKNKADVIYKLKHNHVSLEIKNSGVLLQGDLHAHVDAEASTWTLNGQRSETS